MAMTPSGIPVSAATQATKQRWNCSASSDGEDVAEMIVRRRAIRERPEAAQQVELLAAEQGDIGDGFGTGQHGEQAEEQDLVQRVGHLPLLARVLQILEITQKNNGLVECRAIRCRVFHGSSPACESRVAIDSAL